MDSFGNPLVKRIKVFEDAPGKWQNTKGFYHTGMAAYSLDALRCWTETL